MVGESLIITATFDRVGEFAFHYPLKTIIIVCYFCDAGCPSQKDLAENRMGKMRYSPWYINARFSRALVGGLHDW